MPKPAQDINMSPQQALTKAYLSYGQWLSAGKKESRNQKHDPAEMGYYSLFYKGLAEGEKILERSKQLKKSST